MKAENEKRGIVRYKKERWRSRYYSLLRRWNGDADENGMTVIRGRRLMSVLLLRTVRIVFLTLASSRRVRLSIRLRTCVLSSCSWSWLIRVDNHSSQSLSFVLFYSQSILKNHRNGQERELSGGYVKTKRRWKKKKMKKKTKENRKRTYKKYEMKYENFSFLLFRRVASYASRLSGRVLGPFSSPPCFCFFPQASSLSFFRYVANYSFRSLVVRGRGEIKTRT